MTKKFFREWLLDALEEGDKNSFEECVLNIGKEWHVIRTVETNKQKKFINNLWENRDKIKNGTYNAWASSKYKAYSYENKVCFLINPAHYKIIYDGNNRKSLRKITNVSYFQKDWQKGVDDYYEKYHKGETRICKIFEIDFDLWSVSQTR